MVATLGIDAGNYDVKVVSSKGTDRFRSAVGEYRERRIIEKHGDDDMVWEWSGHKGTQKHPNKGFAGTLALAESRHYGSLMGTTKAHEEAYLRVMLAIFRNTDDKFVRVVVGQPLAGAADKEAMKAALKGRQQVTVNGVTKSFIIDAVEVAMEGCTAFWSAPEPGLIRVVDVGSGTVNLITLNNKRFVDRESSTLSHGTETELDGEVDPVSLSRSIGIHARKQWDKQDTVWVVGGSAEVVQPFLTEFFPNARLLQPHVRIGESTQMVSPAYANAAGLYNIGKVAF